MLHLSVIVHPLELHLQRDDLLVKQPGVDGPGCALVAAQGKGVLIFTGNLELPGDLLAGKAHRHVVRGVGAHQFGVR